MVVQSDQKTTQAGKEAEECMIPNRNEIIKDSQEVYALIRQHPTCSYKTIQTQLRLSSTCLCLALLQLIRERKIVQHYQDGSTYYTVIQEGDIGEEQDNR